MLFGIRTTIGQERLVAETLEKRAKKDPGVVSLVVIDGMRGYVFAEGGDEADVRKIIQKAPHVRGLVRGAMKPAEIEHFFETKTMTAGIERGDTVEITSGAFKGEKAKVIRIDDSKEKITVEIIEAAVPIPITVGASSIRVVQKGS